MIATTGILAVLLTFVDPTPAPAECALTDNQCKARRYEQRAAVAPTAGQRALYLHSAYRSYLFLFEKTGDLRDLCAARRTFDASLAVDGLPAPQRAKFVAGREELVAHERQYEPHCGTTARRRARKPDPPLVARAQEPVPPGESTAPYVAPLAEPPMTGAQDSEDALMPVRASGVKYTQPVEPSRPQPTRAPRPGRALVIAGGTTLGVGIALTAGAGHMGSLMGDMRQEILSLKERADAYGTPEQDAKDEALRDEYHETRTRTVVLGVASGTAVIVAAILVSIGARRMARAASRAAVLPAPGGLVFQGRF